MQGKDDLLSHFNKVLWEPRLAYLADIFEQLNRLNLKLQGKEKNVFHLMDSLRGFLVKLQKWAFWLIRQKRNLRKQVII